MCALLQVFKKMVEVVHHCHELGVMHRDLKPENFLLTSKGPEGELKLTGTLDDYSGSMQFLAKYGKLPCSSPA